MNHEIDELTNLQIDELIVESTDEPSGLRVSKSVNSSIRQFVNMIDLR